MVDRHNAGTLGRNAGRQGRAREDEGRRRQRPSRETPRGRTWREDRGAGATWATRAAAADANRTRRVAAYGREAAQSSAIPAREARTRPLATASFAVSLRTLSPRTSQIASYMASPAGRVAASNDGTLLALARSPDVGTCPSCLSHGQRRRTHHRQPHASRCEPSSPYPNGPSHVDSRESLRRLLDEPKIQIPLSLFWPPNRFPVVSSYDHITPAPPVPARLSPPLHP